MATSRSDSSRPAPLITVMHASVGSGHRAAAMAIASAVERMRGQAGVPEDAEVEVLDILDFGRVRIDGNKTAASFTGATSTTGHGATCSPDACSGAAVPVGPR